MNSMVIVAGSIKVKSEMALTQVLFDGFRSKEQS